VGFYYKSVYGVKFSPNRPTDRPTDRPTSRYTVLLEKLIVPYIVKIFPTFYATSSVSTLFTKARHLPLSWAKGIRSTHSVHLILSSCTRRGVPSGLFCSGHPNPADIKIYYFLFHFTVVTLTALHTNESVSTTANDYSPLLFPRRLRNAQNESHDAPPVSSRPID
jgi:hypothetical protein